MPVKTGTMCCTLKMQLKGYRKTLAKVSHSQILFNYIYVFEISVLIDAFVLPDNDGTVWEPEEGVREDIGGQEGEEEGIHDTEAEGEGTKENIQHGDQTKWTDVGVAG